MWFASFFCSCFSPTCYRPSFWALTLEFWRHGLKSQLWLWKISISDFLAAQLWASSLLALYWVFTFFILYPFKSKGGQRYEVTYRAGVSSKDINIYQYPPHHLSSSGWHLGCFQIINITVVLILLNHSTCYYPWIKVPEKTIPFLARKFSAKAVYLSHVTNFKKYWYPVAM